jgi:hypothetical protein
MGIQWWTCSTRSRWYICRQWPIVLSVLLRYTDSDYPFGIFKLFSSIKTYHIIISSRIIIDWLIISVDNDGNVYVVGRMSNNVVVISPDGQRHRHILSPKDGLVSPTVLDYDKSTNRLLAVNEERTVFSCICMFCWSLFVLLHFFFWPLCCLFFFDIRILITLLVS